MTYSIEEKILILGALFHDIGKFEQRCTNPGKKHQELGGEFLETLKNEILPVLNNSEEDFRRLQNCVKNHHQKDTSDILTATIRFADHISAGERVEFDENEEPGERWQHKYLASVVAKLRIKNDAPSNTYLKYYKQKPLREDYFDFMIPDFDSEQDALDSGNSYLRTSEIFKKFMEELRSVFLSYKVEDDFNGLINILLLLLEKYTWCIPDFTGSEETDISLFNHLKDVAGFAHSIFKSSGSADAEKRLALIIGDLPGIQNYIFDIAAKKPAKILRGRSIFVQVITRIFATIFLKEFGLTEASLVMLAGGKFYLIAPVDNLFYEKFNNAKKKIERLLSKNFNYELVFASGYNIFNPSDLVTKPKATTFGEIVDSASLNLLNGRYQAFSEEFFGDNSINNFIQNDDYIEVPGSDKVKCEVTQKPIRKGRAEKIPDEHLERIDKQVLSEYKIGKEIPYGSVGILLDEELSRVIEVQKFNNIEHYFSGCYAVILNPDVDEIITSKNRHDLIFNSSFINVANYCTLQKKSKTVMDFEEMEAYSEGAKMLTLIKGDIDNLGLLMSTGLVSDDKNLSAVSRTTTLSYHLKYFFSYFVNGYLNQNQGRRDNTDSLYYTVFAGGDDIMIVTTHSNSLRFLQALNEKFSDFACGNPEIHISWSLTNFRHHQPIRIIADFADDSQDAIKDKFKRKKGEPFTAESDKAGAMLYDIPVKNMRLEKLLEYQALLYKWTERRRRSDKPVLSQGVIRNLLLSAEMMREFREKKETARLLWHPVLTHLINRELKKKEEGEMVYKHPEIEEFIESVLSISKDKEQKELEQILIPLLCSIIYLNRNRKPLEESN